ncbi:MAG: hypothetical protein J2P25_14505 [Nocardiopsaceae bacterium]|nr:hypothetical protein [Nocardiopsaceae bacterium]
MNADYTALMAPAQSEDEIIRFADCASWEEISYFAGLAYDYAEMLRARNDALFHAGTADAVTQASAWGAILGWTLMKGLDAFNAADYRAARIKHQGHEQRR